MAIKTGDNVSVQYKGTFDDGTQFDASSPDQPLTFVVGSGQVIEGFDNAVIGKVKGETFTITIPAEQAYGDHDEELVFDIEKSQFPEDIKPELGLSLHVSTDQGELEVTIVDVNETAITLDANHPLAGENLTFEITIV